MAVTTVIPSLFLLSCNLPSSTDYRSKLQPSMFSLLFCLFFFAFSFISLSSLVLSFYKKLRKTEQQGSTTIFQCSEDKTQDRHESKLTHLARSLLLEISPANSPKWATRFNGEMCDQQVPDCSGFDGKRVDSGEEDCGKKKKKKRTKKKRSNSKADDCGEKMRVATEGIEAKEKQELVCLYPFTSSSSATQRKIKQQYDQLVKSHESNGLTLAQVGQFVNCLIEARNELQHKSEVIQRKFTIAKALLCKADRSSFDRLRQQIYKLELEQKRLEEDAFVYNWLQQQLKLSPAYKKMLEIGACTESKASSGERELEESSDAEFAEISFEELLAQEKKDSFWQRNGKHKAC